MSKKIVFTICAKNYLAQALSLKESLLRNNKDVDFMIFLADLADAPKIPEVVTLESGWLKNWKQMAFKYDVVEFSTSIKPFAIDYLLDKGYENVVYLDPDTYVFGSLDYVFSNLKDYSIILTPHRCFPTTTQDPVPDTMVSNVGIYNLGFIALRKDTVSLKITKWWKAKLSVQCYNDVSNGLFVDQKWADFFIGFFPKDILISHNLGLNFAIWNIQERQIFYVNDKAMVKDRLSSGCSNELVFVHFSGFSPLVPDRLDKRLESVTKKTHPELEPLMDEYRDVEIKNNYEYFSSLKYSFNLFDNGLPINSIDRRAFRMFESKWADIDDPFDSKGIIYKTLDQAKLISHDRCLISNVKNPNKSVSISKKYKIAHLLMKAIQKVVGIDRYIKLLRGLNIFSSIDFNSRLLLEKN